MNVRAIAIQGALLVVLFATWLSLKPDDAASSDRNLLDVQLERIHRVEIVKGDRSLILVRQKDGEGGTTFWIAATTHGYPIPEGRIDEFVNPLRQAAAGEYLASDLDPTKVSDRTTLATFGLDEASRTVVRFLDADDEVVSEIHFGKIQTYDRAGKPMIFAQDEPPMPMGDEREKEQVFDTHVYLPKSGEVRLVREKFEASVDPKDWIETSISGLAEADKKGIEQIQLGRRVKPEEKLFFEYEAQKYPVVEEIALLRRVEKKKETEKKDAEKKPEPEFAWELEVFYHLQLPEGVTRDPIPAEGKQKIYEADATAVAGLLDSIVRLQAQGFLEPVEFRETDLGLQRLAKAHFTDDREFLVLLRSKGSDPKKFYFGRLAPEEKEKKDGEPEAKGKPWCYAYDTRYWRIEREDEAGGGPIPFGGAKEGDGPKKAVFQKIGLFEIDEWAYTSLAKEAFDFAKPEEGEFEEVPLAGGVAREAVDRIRLVLPGREGEATVEKTLELDREGAEWRLASAHGYPADGAKVETLLDAVFSAKRARIRARNPRLHKKFDLGSGASRRVVLVDTEGKDLLTLVLGRTDPFARIPDENGEEKTTPTTYVLDADGKTVREYVVEIDPRATPEEWVDKKLVAIPKFRVDRFELVLDGKTHAFARKASESGDEARWVVAEGESEIEARKDPIDRLLDAAAGLQFDTLAEPVAWPEGQAAPDGSGLAKYGLDSPDLVLVLHGREGLDEDRVLAFAKVEPPKNEEKEGEEGHGHPHDEPAARSRHYVAVGAWLDRGGSTAGAFAGTGEGRGLAVYELTEWTAEAFQKTARDFYDIEARHAVVRWKGAPGAGEDVTRSKEEAQALAAKLSAEKTLEGGDSIEGLVLPETYWKSAYALAPGGFSEPIETDSGYVVIERVK